MKRNEIGVFKTSRTYLTNKDEKISAIIKLLASLDETVDDDKTDVLTIKYIC